ncbi:MAG TPA: dTDP-glucose 4,6-dehydratase [Lentisphaeria bacterium]|nr:MAG: dTDP-glucose 4,6-dehydratase [Lentisphaerae bacterium GWF2_49_21]HBC87469.1 dTDP-glucose 4,6-dehydratase [Lentisphaeria bacterium]
MKTILVTGGAGFIGANFVRMILSERKNIKVVNLDALTYAGNLENLSGFMENKNHDFVHGDIRSHELVEKLLKEHKIDGIINFAAESHVDRSISSPGIFIDTNISGALNLLQCAKELGVKRFLQVSTDEVYGSLSPDEDKFSEETSMKPNSPYSASKAAADHLVRAFQHTYHIDTVITRCSNNYGPYQFPEKMIPLCINNIRNGKQIPVYGDGMQIRDWLYVYDHCTAIMQVFEKGESGEVYNIGGNNEKTNLALVKTLLKLLGKDESLIKFIKDRPGHDRRYAIDNSKITNSLGWKPSVTFEQGIARTVDWYLKNKAWLDHVTSGEYQKYYEKMYK